MKRRAFITLLGGAAAWPLAAYAQDGRTYRIGVLNANPRGSPLVTALFDELRRNGLVEGRNLVMEGSGIGIPYPQFRMWRASWPRPRSMPSWSVAAAHQFAPSKLSHRGFRSSAWPMIWSLQDWRSRWSSLAATLPGSVSSPPNSTAKGRNC
jgi:hypothetical protein